MFNTTQPRTALVSHSRTKQYPHRTNQPNSMTEIETSLQPQFNQVPWQPRGSHVSSSPSSSFPNNLGSPEKKLAERVFLPSSVTTTGASAIPQSSQRKCLSKIYDSATKQTYICMADLPPEVIQGNMLAQVVCSQCARVHRPSRDIRMRTTSHLMGFQPQSSSRSLSSYIKPYHSMPFVRSPNATPMKPDGPFYASRNQHPFELANSRASSLLIPVNDIAAAAGGGGGEGTKLPMNTLASLGSLASSSSSSSSSLSLNSLSMLNNHDDRAFVHSHDSSSAVVHEPTATATKQQPTAGGSRIGHDTVPRRVLNIQTAAGVLKPSSHSILFPSSSSSNFASFSSSSSSSSASSSPPTSSFSSPSLIASNTTFLHRSPDRSLASRQQQQTTTSSSIAGFTIFNNKKPSHSALPSSSSSSSSSSASRRSAGSEFVSAKHVAVDVHDPPQLMSKDKESQETRTTNGFNHVSDQTQQQQQQAPPNKVVHLHDDHDHDDDNNKDDDNDLLVHFQQQQEKQLRLREQVRQQQHQQQIRVNNALWNRVSKNWLREDHDNDDDNEDGDNSDARQSLVSFQSLHDQIQENHQQLQQFAASQASPNLSIPRQLLQLPPRSVAAAATDPAETPSQRLLQSKSMQQAMQLYVQRRQSNGSDSGSRQQTYGDTDRLWKKQKTTKTNRPKTAIQSDKKQNKIPPSSKSAAAAAKRPRSAMASSSKARVLQAILLSAEAQFMSIQWPVTFQLKTQRERTEILTSCNEIWKTWQGIQKSKNLVCKESLLAVVYLSLLHHHHAIPPSQFWFEMRTQMDRGPLTATAAAATSASQPTNATTAASSSSTAVSSSSSSSSTVNVHDLNQGIFSASAISKEFNQQFRNLIRDLRKHDKLPLTDNHHLVENFLRRNFIEVKHQKILNRAIQWHQLFNESGYMDEPLQYEQSRKNSPTTSIRGQNANLFTRPWILRSLVCLQLLKIIDKFHNFPFTIEDMMVQAGVPSTALDQEYHRCCKFDLIKSEIKSAQAVMSNLVNDGSGGVVVDDEMDCMVDEVDAEQEEDEEEEEEEEQQNDGDYEMEEDEDEDDQTQLLSDDTTDIIMEMEPSFHQRPSALSSSSSQKQAIRLLASSMIE
jgi:hypothetical protein